MSKQEAIKVLSEIRDCYDCFDPEEEPCYNALSTAIRAVRDQIDKEDDLK